MNASVNTSVQEQGDTGLRRAVVIAAGGTGGHVVPALAVAAALKAQNIPVIWFGTREGLEAQMVPSSGIDMRWIDIFGFRGKGVLHTLFAPLKLLRAVVQSAQQLRVINPRAVLGMGGFVSGPVGLAALVLRTPLVLHEQNAVAGMTNQWLSRMAARVFSAWPNVFPVSRGAVHIGNPVRAEMELLAAEPLTSQANRLAALRVLVVGGSRGAQVLNELVPQAAALSALPLSIHHQCGAGNAESVQECYSNLSNEDVVVSEFIEEMTAAYQQADLVICRSGAMTVTELSALAMPSILVPFPFAVDDHQTQNARHLSDAGAAKLLPQESLSAESLAEMLDTLAGDRVQLRQMSEAARSRFMPNAAQAVASALVEVSR